MYIKDLTLNNFKNFTEKEFNFSKINCIVGNNGVGKTNILDAIYYLSFCRSFLGCSEREIINYQADYFAIRGHYLLNEDSEETFLISMKKGEKKIVKHGKNVYKKLSEHIGKIPCVVISPNDQMYITGRSEIRRKFLDMVLSQTDTVYIDSLINYNKCLEQRNKLLKNTFVLDTIQLEVWNERLTSFAEIIQNKRREFFEEFLPTFQYYYNYISENKETINAKYSTFGGNLLDILKKNIEKERILQYTTAGIHRDDILFTLNNHMAAHTASQGQQKTFIIALKLAQFTYLQKHKNTIPILLLDDIFDKFDFHRIEMLLNLVAESDFNQVFLTDTHSDRVEKIIPQDKKSESVIINL